MTTAGLLLAAGAGRRMGQPKALVTDADGTPWVHRAATVLAEGGCDPVLVVLGAAADQVRQLLPDTAIPVFAADWEQGMGASLRAGLAALPETAPHATAVLVGLVDTPGVTAGVVARLLSAGTDPGVLARAVYHSAPGHPVLIGRDHWAEAARVATGDRGARDLLARPGVRLIECGDVGDGADVDRRT
ncbi:nucleotidyltransferase family protein [Naumannella sp. ID2617S]|nr:nucleotidyltransferase family protein [Naumannella sp. ID2617S]